MATKITLPKLGMNTERAKILNWLKKEGDTITIGDVIAEVETEKATIDLEAEAAGVLRRLLADEGDEVEVNQPIAIVGSATEDISAIEQQVRNTPKSGSSHVEKIYQSWKASPPANGHVAATRELGSMRVANVATATGNGASSDRLDPAAIRNRLANRGILNTPSVPSTKTRIAIYGSGLGAKQLLEITRHLDDTEVVGLIDDNPELRGVLLGGVSVIGGFADLKGLVAKREIDGVVLSFHSEVRKKIHERIKRELGIRIYPLVDPRAMVGMDVTIEDGALVEAGAVIGPGTTVGEGTIVDVGAVIAHDCVLGTFSHLSPGCVLSGVVSLTENVLVGVGASLNSTITIGRNVIITPGAAVMNDIPDDVVVAGVPAKIIGKSRRGA